MARRGAGEGSIYPYRDGWAAQVQVSARPRRRKTVYGRTRKEVQQKMQAVQRQLHLGQPISPERLTVAGYLTSWLEDTLPDRVRAGRLAQSTADSYAANARLHITPHLGTVRLAQLRPSDLRGWLAELLDKPQRPGCVPCSKADRPCPKHEGVTFRPLSPRTVAYCHAILRKALADAVDDELITRNVALLVDAPEVPKHQARPLTMAEARTLLVALAGDRFEALWLTYLSLGLRRGEAIALRWDDVDLDVNTVDIVKGKTDASEATISLLPLLADALTRHRTRQRAARLAARVWVDPELVFTTGVGTALSPRNVNRAWDALCVRAGIRRVKLHDLRHTAATFMLAAGADMKTVQHTLRHTRLATTSDIYGHVLEEVQRDAAARMDGFLRELGWQ